MLESIRNLPTFGEAFQNLTAHLGKESNAFVKASVSSAEAAMTVGKAARADIIRFRSFMVPTCSPPCYCARDA